jgi:putative ABC transport system substrate-binding protein
MQFGQVNRRNFIALLGGAATLPLAARAQQPERMRRIGVLMLYPENDPAGQLRATAFRQGLEKLGWAVGRNVQIDFQWGLGDADWIRSAAAQLLQLAPDVILANGDAAARMVQQSTRTVPVIFIAGSDAVANGLVQNLAHPGGNLTGFTVLEPSLGAKLLELLKEIAPSVARVAVLFNQDNPGNRGVSASAAAAAARFAVEVVAVPLRESNEIEAEIEAAMAQWGREPDYGLIVLPDPSTNSHRKLIIELAARHRLPAIHALRAATADGGLMSYGVDLPELFRQAAAYADRILKGDKPADLPVQLPTKFELVINLKTAKALGLTVPLIMQMTADEAIE